TVVAEDWNNEDVPGIFVTQVGKSPTFFSKQRAGDFVVTNATPALPAGTVLGAGDLRNDLRVDFLLAKDPGNEIVFFPTKAKLSLPLKGLHAKGISLMDYDNDGWLDVIAYGDGLRVWRNRGAAGFADVTGELGLSKVLQVDSIVAADFDGDGATD